jgi:phosphoserine phosphatase
MNLPLAIDEFLASHIVSPREVTPLAVIDCDGTIIKGDIGEAMLYFQLERFLFRESPASLWPDYPDRKELERLYQSLVRNPPFIGSQDERQIAFANHLLDWYFGQLKAGQTMKACVDIVRLWSGFRETEVVEIARDTLKAELAPGPAERLLGKHLLPRGIGYIRETREMLDRIRAAGFNIWVVSGSNLWSVREVCRHLPVTPTQIAGITLGRKGDLISAQVIHPVPVVEGKVDLMKAKGFPQPSIVVSNSVHDLPLYEYCSGLKVLIQSDTQADGFFERTGIRPDESWVVIRQPTVEYGLQ